MTSPRFNILFNLAHLVFVHLGYCSGFKLQIDSYFDMYSTGNSDFAEVSDTIKTLFLFFLQIIGACSISLKPAFIISVAPTADSEKPQRSPNLFRGREIENVSKRENRLKLARHPQASLALGPPTQTKAQPYIHLSSALRMIVLSWALTSPKPSSFHSSKPTLLQKPHTTVTEAYARFRLQDISVGTGYFLIKACLNHVFDLFLLDLNLNCLKMASARACKVYLHLIYLIIYGDFVVVG
ncbi:hypothetical protein MPH_04999 [Macrophomina phaseolina MS6]|uniref:Uncharacterized protein n=1 Tax=Macrophomina phaseolina (strain MS6) TaxID=1126212 RepID=K2S5F3_MACPH|nr:hypothetical protein MPH_04999 [Macrophomina phaseolina MS6]